MKRSTDRILVSHAGTLPRPADLQEIVDAGQDRAEEARGRLPSAVAEVLRKQAAVGVDVVNDGEYSKLNFTHYVQQRFSGLETPQPGQSMPNRSIVARDKAEFPGFHERGGGFRFNAASGVNPANINPGMLCSGPLRYVGQVAAQADIANIKAAAEGLDVEPFLPAIAPGTIEHWLFNAHYKDDEELLFAVAEAMREEYKAITDAGLLLQIDDPDLPDGWQMFPDMSVDDYRTYARLRVDALNHALRDIPTEQIRLHVCWGSGHGPHKNDLPLEHLVDVILNVRAGCYSIEASNPRHEHEWRVWQTAKLPDGASLMPGVVGHASDVVEHPRLVADRLVRYAGLVGRENVIAGTDCGIGSRVGHGEIAWAKLAAMAEGARIASSELW